MSKEKLKQALKSEEGKQALGQVASELIWEAMKKHRSRDLTELTREVLGSVCRKDFGRKDP